MGKLIELEEKERLKETDKIEAVAGSLGLGTYSSLHAFEFKPLALEKFGLCSSCMALSYARRKYTVAKVWCSELEIRLRDNDPIIECTEFEKRFSLSLQSMKDMALLIDLKENNPAGFITEE